MPDNDLILSLLQRQDEKIDRIAAQIELLVRQRTVKEYYTVGEFASFVGLAEYTVREHCRTGRIAAGKRDCGRAGKPEWNIPHAELVRYENHGLLPDPALSRNGKVV